jgi:hypothetical protein
MKQGHPWEACNCSAQEIPRLFTTFTRPRRGTFLEASSCFPIKILYTILSAPKHATWPAHLTFLDLILLMIFCEAPHYAVLSILLSQQPPQHPILKSPPSTCVPVKNMALGCAGSCSRTLLRCVYVAPQPRLSTSVFISCNCAVQSQAILECRTSHDTTLPFQQNRCPAHNLW